MVSNDGGLVVSADSIRFLKNEAYDPTNIDDDAIEEYVSKFSQPGGLRSMFNICRCQAIANFGTH
jgi:hypothetical protein